MPSTMFHPVYASMVQPTQAPAPAVAPALNSADVQALKYIAEWLEAVDRAGSTGPGALSAIERDYPALKRTDYPLQPISATYNALYTKATAAMTVSDPARVQETAKALRELAGKYAALETQLAAAQQEIARLTAVPQPVPIQTAPVVPAAAPAKSDGPGWGTFAISVGILAVLGIGAWYLMKHRPAQIAATPREPQEPQEPARRLRRKS